MKRAAVVLVLLFALPLSVHAGTTGCLSGTVTDDSGVPVANALVTATSPSQIVATRTDAQGRFVFISLTPGQYAITALCGRWRTNETAIVRADAMSRVDVIAHIAKDRSRFGRIWTIIEDFRHRTLVRPGAKDDLYSYFMSDDWPPTPSHTNQWLLRMTPGVTSGPGSVIPH